MSDAVFQERTRGDALKTAARDIVDKVLQYDEFETLLLCTLGDIRRLLNADSACAFELFHDGESLRIGRSVNDHMPGSVMSGYSAGFVNFDPICGRLFTADGGFKQRRKGRHMSRLSDAVDHQCKEHLIYINDFLKKEHLDHVLGVSLRSTVKDSPLLVIGLQRSGDCKDFGHRDMIHAEYLSNVFLHKFDYFAIRQEYEALTGKSDGTDKYQCFEISVFPDESLSTYRIVGDLKECVYQSQSSRVRHPNFRLFLEDMSRRDCLRKNQISVLRSIGVRGIPADVRMMLWPAEKKGAVQTYRLFVVPLPKIGGTDIFANNHDLTKREMDIVLTLADGLQNKEIAEALGISTRTVENHLRNIFQKVHVNSRLEVISRLNAAKL